MLLFQFLFFNKEKDNCCQISKVLYLKKGIEAH